MIQTLPTVNASLNGLAAVLLILGWIYIKRGDVARHKACMIAAFVASALFLGCYLFYHYLLVHYHNSAGKPFPHKESVWYTVYLIVLIPHVLLAIGMLPMIGLTFWRAFAGDFARHKRIAVWTLPIWIYVSVTGVVVYLMLYIVPWDRFL